jgi:NADH-quinone oxidoreductase subunit E
VDDLKLIKGVGPKLEALLHSLGFFHFDQIANWTEAELAWVDENLEGFKGRVIRENWVEQARAFLSDKGRG